MEISLDLDLSADLRELVDDVERYVDVFVGERPLRIVARYKVDEVLEDHVTEGRREKHESLHEYAEAVVRRCIDFAKQKQTRVLFLMNGMPEHGRREHVFVQFALQTPTVH